MGKEIIMNQNIQLYFGDCLELMKKIPDKAIDMILTDPPYGRTCAKWDNIIEFDKLWEQYERIIKENGAIVLFAQSPFDKLLACSNLKLFRYEWIWQKTQATGHLNANRMPLKAHENILVFYKKLPVYHPQKTLGHPPSHKSSCSIEKQNQTTLYQKVNQVHHYEGGSTERYPRDVICFSSDKQTCYLHPTQKPVALCEYLIKTYTDKNDVVLDSCMGSGTTGVACITTQRKFIGMEKDEQFFSVARNRIEKFRGESQ